MKKTLKVFNELKRKKIIKDYAIGGAIAALRWTEPFLTQDLDIFIITEKSEKGIIDLSQIYKYLKDKGYVWKAQWIIIEGIPVDIFPAEGLEKEAVEKAKEIKYEGVKTKVIIPEYLIALFLKAGRKKNIIKVQMLLEQCKINKKILIKVLKKYGLYEKFMDLKIEWEK